jgi:hypothetical protein
MLSWWRILFGLLVMAAAFVLAAPTQRSRQSRPITESDASEFPQDVTHANVAKTKAELIEEARKLAVPGRSRMTKSELAQAIQTYKQGSKKNGARRTKR